ncbi:hypothetical protein ACVWXN_006025 [Bradyrhizobium sp. i1.4.4]
MPGGLGSALKISRGLMGFGFALLSRSFLKSTIRTSFRRALNPPTALA